MAVSARIPDTGMATTVPIIVPGEEKIAVNTYERSPVIAIGLLV